MNLKAKSHCEKDNDWKNRQIHVWLEGPPPWEADRPQGPVNKLQSFQEDEPA